MIEEDILQKETRLVYPVIFITIGFLKIRGDCSNAECCIHCLSGQDIGCECVGVVLFKPLCGHSSCVSHSHFLEPTAFSVERKGLTLEYDCNKIH